MEFSKEFFINNRRRLAEALPDSLIVVSGNRPMQLSGDTTYPFKQDGNFWYLTGINEPNLILVINTRDNTEMVIYSQKKGVELIFEGQIDVANLREISGIKNFATKQEAIKDLAVLKSFKKVHMNLAAKRKGIVVNNLRQKLYEELKKYCKSISDIRPTMDKLRMIKQPEEINAIKTAVSITKKSLEIAEQTLKNAANEKEILAAINQHLALVYANHAFEPIVASGKNSLTLHYVKNNGPISTDNQAVLLDIGTEFNNYTSDLSRTFALNKKGKASEVIQAVDSCQKQIIKNIKIGMTWKELQAMSEQMLLSELKAIGEDVNEDNIKQFYPNAIGHHIGLGVHDTGDYRRPLAENMTLAIEPCYCNPRNGFGVRVEDNVLITKTGAIIL